MINTLRWFAPPVLSSHDLRRRAESLWIVSWPFFAVVTVMLSIAVLVEPETLQRRAVTLAAVGALIVVLHTISRSGRPVLASWILVIGLSVIVTERAWITGGIHAPVQLFYALFIVMAGSLIGVRGSLATAAVCLLGTIVLTIGTALEWLAPRPGAGPIASAFLFAVLAIGLALVIQALVAVRLRPATINPDAVQLLVHDMRSPMQILLAHLDVLQNEIRGENTKDVEGALSGAMIIDRITSNLLDAGRLEAGAMPVRPSFTNLAAVTRSVVSGLRILQPARSVHIETTADPLCSCDFELTRRIIENLVSNAMKHTPLEGRVHVLISGSAERASIAVSDEGPGVPPSKRQQIFEPYGMRSEQSSAGYGLGLAFCKLAAEAQGGTIRIEDGSPRGSVFIVELPRRPRSG